MAISVAARLVTTSISLWRARTRKNGAHRSYSGQPAAMTLGNNFITGHAGSPTSRWSVISMQHGAAAAAAPACLGSSGDEIWAPTGEEGEEETERRGWIGGWATEDRGWREGGGEAVLLHPRQPPPPPALKPAPCPLPPRGSQLKPAIKPPHRDNTILSRRTLIKDQSSLQKKGAEHLSCGCCLSMYLTIFLLFIYISIYLFTYISITNLNISLFFKGP